MTESLAIVEIGIPQLLITYPSLITIDVEASLLEEDDEDDELLNNYLRNDMRDETDNETCT
jgi:hypothetical protein